MNAIRKCHTWPAALLLGMLAAVSMLAMAVPMTASAQDAGQHLRAFIERLNEGTAKGDFDYAVSLQAEDGIRVHPIAGVIKGRKGLRDYFAHLAESWSQTKETITWLAVDGNHVGAAITWEATNRKSGRQVKLPMALLADFDANGMIQWSQVYFYVAPPRKDAK